eukprot:CAMPEP_0117752838 /NCGR_PEP_ID=MMETSP0947-20121206/11865_1 /TAXON_ID=44440 /ORGANISM="Chattonella subsalsa, Strain CCMP2191" /LENGTH=313 /DNA_ID=CAMNT_0005571599 /DNA_START=158 /DNA_END=1096 /DNA_ORIENTATION=+
MTNPPDVKQLIIYFFCLLSFFFGGSSTRWDYLSNTQQSNELSFLSMKYSNTRLPNYFTQTYRTPDVKRNGALLQMVATKTKKKQKVKKVRIDDLLVKRGYAEDRKSAGAFVLAGDVFIKNDQKVLTAAEKVAEDSLLRVRRRMEHGWVGRGGIKLKGAIDYFNLQDQIKDVVAIDIGSSTGGFTDVLLAHNASKVYAVDVGYSLLDYRLRIDPRVVLLERTNARYLNSSHIKEEDLGRVGAVVCDASFISLKTVLPPAMSMCQIGAILVALIKPQFEADRSDVGEGGVISDGSVHQKVCDDITTWLESTQVGW